MNLLITSESRRQEFEQLHQQWLEMRNNYSSDTSDWAICWPYQRIIGMGPVVLPLILEQLQKRPDHWFWALSAISGECPILPDHEGYFDLMVKDWLDWGKKQGLLP